MFLRFQKAAVRENCETGNQALSMRLKFLTIRDLPVLVVMQSHANLFVTSKCVASNFS